MIKIKVVEDFSPSPGGRFRRDGPYSGEQFREEVLRPALQTGDILYVDLDGAFGYPSSFLEEAFGGLIRNGILSASDALKRFHFVASGPYEIYVEDILKYFRNAGRQAG